MESAGHSAFYATAIMIKARAFGTGSVEPEKFADPAVLDLIEKITVSYDPDLPEFGRYGISEIGIKDGGKFEKRIDNPRGFGNGPLVAKASKITL